jgi:hypothetical protein
LSIGTVDQDDPEVAGAHRMSSPQYPVRLLFVATALSCMLTGCASKQAPSPEIAGGKGEDPARERFLSASQPDDSLPGTAVGTIEPGAPLDPQNIDAILDEMLAGHEALQSRKVQEAVELPVDPELVEVSSSVVQVGALESADQPPGESLSESSELGETTSDEKSMVASELPQIEPSKEMIRALMASAANSDAPLKQHLALAMLMAWVSPDKPFEPAGLSELTEQERTVVSIVYEHFKSLGTELDDGGGEDDLLNALTGIIDAVEGEAPFQISRMELCSWVRDFGDIDVIEPLTFSPKERPRFIWYVELDGVDPTQNAASGEWAHEFDVKVEVLTKDTGIPVISPIQDRVRYASSSRLRDLFLRNILEIPEDLQFDWYTTKVTITEVSSGIRSQKSLDLLWVPNLAAGESHFLRQATAEE